jgi:hypothetical protein
MKQQIQTKKKLTLKKSTVTLLDQNYMQNMNGGTGTLITCRFDTTPQVTCQTVSCACATVDVCRTHTC